MLAHKKMEIRSRIVKSQREGYFQQIREAKLYEFACSQRLQKTDVNSILAKLGQPTLIEEDIQLIYEYARLGPKLNDALASQFAYKILTKHRTNGILLQTICLLIEKCPFLIEDLAKQDGLLQQMVKENMQNSDNLLTVMIFIVKIFEFNQNSIFFDWLFPEIETIIESVGLCSVSICLFHQCCKYSSLFPNRQLVYKVASSDLQGQSEQIYRMVSEILLAYFRYNPQGNNFGLVVVWVNTRLQNEYLSGSVQLILTQTLVQLLMMDISKEFIEYIVKEDHQIIKKVIVLVTDGASYTVKMNSIISLCKIITDISNNYLISFAQKYNLSEPFTRAFDLPLLNSAKLDLLFSISLLFEADPQFKWQFLKQGGMQGIQQFMDTKVAALWEMIQVVIFQLKEEQGMIL